MLSKIAVPVLMATAAVAAPQGPGAVEAEIHGRSTGGRVNNGNVANYNNGNIQDGNGDGSPDYTMYWGDGTTGSGWPGKDRWVSFENMFNNKNAMFHSCQNFGVANNSGPEVGAIWDGIQKVAQETGVDHRFILAVIMQVSSGCVRVHTTGGDNHRSPGLMQDHNGDATCHDYGRVQNPCPRETIEGMIREGTAGTRDGDGLTQCLNEAGREDVSVFYRAARYYNSGEIANHLEDHDTRCYASDIANRLTGWTGERPSKCPFN